MQHQRVVLITAGTRGIGRVIARRFAEEGAILALNYLSKEEEAENTLNEIRKLSPKSQTYRADVSDATQAQTLIENVVDHFGRIDVLVNNAGPMLVKPLFDTSPEEWEWMIRSNLSSAFFCTQCALRQMRKQKSGQIVNLGCLHGEIAPGGLPNSPAYGIAKAALLMMTRLFARSEAKYNIRINAVNPGLIESDDYAKHSMAEREKWISRVPQGRFGLPEEIAEAVLFLCSDKSAYISGAVLPVHGGLWIP